MKQDEFIVPQSVGKSTIKRRGYSDKISSGSTGSTQSVLEVYYHDSTCETAYDSMYTSADVCWSSWTYCTTTCSSIYDVEIHCDGAFYDSTWTLNIGGNECSGGTTYTGTGSTCIYLNSQYQTFQCGPTPSFQPSIAPSNAAANSKSESFFSSPTEGAGIISGIVIGGVVAIAILIAAIHYFKFARNSKSLASQGDVAMNPIGKLGDKPNEEDTSL
jgi:hypothetical protein